MENYSSANLNLNFIDPVTPNFPPYSLHPSLSTLHPQFFRKQQRRRKVGVRQYEIQEGRRNAQKRTTPLQVFRFIPVLAGVLVLDAITNGMIASNALLLIVILHTWQPTSHVKLLSGIFTGLIVFTSLQLSSWSSSLFSCLIGSFVG